MFTFKSVFSASFKFFRENSAFLSIISVICGIALFAAGSASIAPLQNHYPELFEPNANYIVIFQSFNFDIPFFIDVSVFLLVMSFFSLAAMLVVLQGIKNIETNEPDKYNCLRIWLNLRVLSDNLNIVGIILGGFILATLIPFAVVVGATFVTHEPVILMTLLAAYILINIFGLMIVWNFSVIAVIVYLVSGRKWTDNIKYSWKLSYPYTLRILGYALLLTLLMVFADLVATLPVEALIPLFNANPDMKNIVITLSALFGSIISSILMTLYWIFYIKVYQALVRIVNRP